VRGYPSGNHLRSQWDMEDICNYFCKLLFASITVAQREVNGQRRLGASVASPAVNRGVPSEWCIRERTFCSRARAIQFSVRNRWGRVDMTGKR
jgi:hypothetical protein